MMRNPSAEMILARTNAEHAHWALSHPHCNGWPSMATKHAFYEDMLIRAQLVLCGCILVEPSDLTPKKRTRNSKYEAYE